jgi:hypothetical protein|tara:strand:- start:1771 stop:2076 length:306 start_codon:yes stop_codon:yes gene_type:complete
MSDPNDNDFDYRDWFGVTATVTISVHLQDDSAVDLARLRLIHYIECDEGSSDAWLQPYDQAIEVNGGDDPNLPLGLIDRVTVKVKPKPNFDKDEGENQWIT